MKLLWISACAFLAASPCYGQTLEELQQRLREREAEIQQLRHRIDVLERERTPRRAATPLPAPTDDEGDINRALERALVREGGLLLSPGTFEVEPNFVYSHTSRETVNFRRDAFGPGLSFRIGLPWQSQLEFNVPYVVEYRRSGTESHTSDGFGDPSFGIAHQFLSERGSVPSLIGAISYKPSVGENTVFTSEKPSALGTGFDALQGSLTAVKRVDPLVFFGTYSYSHNFSDRKGGVEVDIGDSNEIRFGTILATSPDTSLRVAFDLTFFEKTRFGGRSLPGTDEPAGIFEIGGSVVLSERMLLDVAVGAGVTSSAPDFRLSVALPFRF